MDLDAMARSLETLGITGIEDKLQVGVEDAIVKIRQAGIKLWVLTGEARPRLVVLGDAGVGGVDKLETAKNIGFSTRVLSSSMEILTLDLTDRRAFKDRHAGRVAVRCSVVIACRVSPLQKAEVAVRCSVVIACRVSPLQKAEVVTVVRTDGKGVKPTPVTLAIGDGANDVPMLQEAQVGVGISGREGRPETSKDAGDREPTSAVNCADFAISQFRYLARLMLVHGRWNYRRACKFVIYSFWKNAVLHSCK
eukprot:g3105.t1